VTVHNPIISLPDTVVLVTGGSRGIGASIARGFLAAGARVVICGRRPPAPDAIPSVGGRAARFVQSDVRKPEDVERLFTQIDADHGRLDVLINNAGGGPPGNMADSSAALIENIVRLNLTASLLCAQAANRRMRSQATGGCIINIGSVAGVRPSPTATVYGAAKAALLHATQSLAMEWGPQVRVNAIVAGLVATENSADHYGGPEGMARIGAMFPLKRMAEPDDIAAACLYLASPAAAYVSGAQLAVHGGGEWPLFLYLGREVKS
jgi:NAD(P)-dependent dehydrogenase (short-subunit alcohol dehydrogenase family)